MKIKGLFAQALLLIGLSGAALSTGQAQDKLPPGIKKGFVTTSDSVKIHYFEAGPKLPRRSPTLLFVPGWMTPGWIWEYQLAHFAKSYRVVAMDPRSQGEILETCGRPLSRQLAHATSRASSINLS